MSSLLSQLFSCLKKRKEPAEKTKYSTRQAALKSAEQSKDSKQEHNLKNAEDALTLIFIIGSSKKERETLQKYKEQICERVADNIHSIEICIDITACQFRTRLDNNVRRKRSALQFLIDNCGVSKKDLSKSVGILDKIIERLTKEDCPDGCWDFFRQNLEIPSSHIWWGRSTAKCENRKRVNECANSSKRRKEPRYELRYLSPRVV